MVSKEKWKEHFRCMAQKGHMHEDDIFIVNQSGWGLGRNAFPKCTLYKVRKTVGGTTPITIASPVAGNLDRARAFLQEGGGKQKKRTYKKKKTKAKSVRKKKATKKKKTKRKTTKKGGKKKKTMRKKKTTYIPKCIKNKYGSSTYRSSSYI